MINYLNNLLEIFDQEFAIAKCKGHVLIRNTELGDLDLFYKDDIYMIESDDNRCLFFGKINDAKNFLINEISTIALFK